MLLSHTMNRIIRRSAAFTLVEMLVTVALMLVLMLAVTQIFSIAGRTMSGGQAIAAAVRDAQAAQAVMAHDFAAAASDGPCFIIRNSRIAAFRNNGDYSSALDTTVVAGPLRDDLDGSNSLDPANATPTADCRYDTDGDGKYDSAYSPLLYNFRNHRLDSIMFFARDRFRRQTGNSLALVDDTSSSEAAIAYEHLWLPDNNIAFTGNTLPGAGDTTSNPNNFFATQWLLGRQAMVMINPPAAWDATVTYTTGQMVTDSGQTYRALQGSLGKTPSSSPDSWVLEVGYAQVGGLTPFAYNSASTDSNPKTPLQGSRYDLALTTISTFKTNQVFAAPIWAVGQSYAVNDFVTDNGNIYYAVTASSPSTAGDQPSTGSPKWQLSNWYDTLMTPMPGGLNRFQANPFVAKPVTPASVSAQAPIFLPACTQFIIEFAGDYVSQIAANPDEWVNTKSYAAGDAVKVTAGSTYTIYVASAAVLANTPPSGGAPWVTAIAGAPNTYKPGGFATPDGQIDFVPNTNQIRWYGLPRDANGDGIIRADDGDVVPVCDVSRQPMPFEKVWPFKVNAPSGLAVASEIPASNLDYYTNTNMRKTGTQIDPAYTVAWGPADTNRPKLVRITLVVDRPEAASNQFDGSTFQYVFKLGL